MHRGAVTLEAAAIDTAVLVVDIAVDTAVLFPETVPKPLMTIVTRIIRKLGSSEATAYQGEVQFYRAVVGPF